MDFFLGTHQPGWLRQTDVPLFLSTRRLKHIQGLPRARGVVAIDSGGYSELSMPPYRWCTSPKAYVAEVRRYHRLLGRVQWAAPQDWMCEPWILEKTGKTITQHQALTVASVLELRSLAPEMSWAPVLQGWELADYLRHVEMYAAVGVDLVKETIVGVGTLCRRQATSAAVEILRALHGLGIALHGFGFKKLGLVAASPYLASADSMAWSFDARRKQRPMCGSPRHKNCANCLVYALSWRRELLALIGG